MNPACWKTKNQGKVEIAEMNYAHLTREERYQIYALKKAGHKQAEIANVLKRSPSTISRELGNL